MLLGRFSKGSRATVGAVLACAVAAIAVAGCGSSSSTSAGSNQVVRAAYVSTSTSGYRMRFGITLSTSALPQPITGAGVGRFNVHQRQGAVTLDMNFGSIPQVASVLGSSTLHLEELIDGTTVYIKLPTSLTSKIPSFGSKPWLKIDLAKAAAAAGVPGLGSLVSNPASSDPSQFLQYLRAAGTVTKIGSDQVNGISTTHYRASIDLDKVPNALPSSSRSQAQAAIAGLEKVTNLHQIPVDVWIDNHNLVRRIRLAFREPVASGQSVSTAINVDIVGYGPQPPPTLPPADQVTDASALAGSSASGSSSSSSGGSSGAYFPGG
jgi:hypothetical protein